jgi:heme-NO-binding protein
MKGVVFTEFLEMVEQSFSIDTAEQIIEQSDLPSGGAYTAVGTYDHDELVQLVTHLSDLSGRAPAELIRTFGHHLFGRFVVAYPYLFENVESTFDFLARVDDTIHVEVRKLYPDAELPRFEVHQPTAGRLEMIYHSQRPFADLAEGLIAGCAEHFGQTIAVSRESLPADQGTAVRFLLICEAEVPQCST